MVTADYHMHSLSPDARVPMDAVCEAAIARGLGEIAVTDHMEMYSPDYAGKEASFFDDAYADRYFAEVERCREKYAGRLVIRAAVELGQPAVNEERAKLLLRRPYDFVLGSVHKLHDVDLAFKVYTPQTLPRLCERNLELLYELADTGDFDVVGHIDLIKRYAFRQSGLLVDLMDYREPLERVLRRLVERGKGIEINTSGLRQPLGLTLPGLAVLKLFREVGGEVLTIGSDAHRAEDVGANLEEGGQLAREAGFRHAATFQNRKCAFYPL